MREVVLHYVAQRTGAFVVGGAMLDAESLGNRDLHLLDTIAVPHRFEDRIGKAKHQKVLNGLLAQVMVDAVDLRFLEVACRTPFNASAEVRSRPNGFSMTMRDQPGPWFRSASPRRVMVASKAWGGNAR